MKELTWAAPTYLWQHLGLAHMPGCNRLPARAPRRRLAVCGDVGAVQQHHRVLPVPLLIQEAGQGGTKAGGCCRPSRSRVLSPVAGAAPRCRLRLPGPPSRFAGLGLLPKRPSRLHGRLQYSHALCAPLVPLLLPAPPATVGSDSPQLIWMCHSPQPPCAGLCLVHDCVQAQRGHRICRLHSAAARLHRRRHAATSAAGAGGGHHRCDLRPEGREPPCGSRTWRSSCLRRPSRCGASCSAAQLHPIQGTGGTFVQGAGGQGSRLYSPYPWPAGSRCCAGTPGRHYAPYPPHAPPPNRLLCSHLVRPVLRRPDARLCRGGVRPHRPVPGHRPQDGRVCAALRHL